MKGRSPIGGLGRRREADRKAPTADYERSEAPYVECPRCHRQAFVVDYFDYGVGSEIECDHCHATLECIEEERTVVWTWRMKGSEAATP